MELPLFRGEVILRRRDCVGGEVGGLASGGLEKLPELAILFGAVSDDLRELQIVLRGAFEG